MDNSCIFVLEQPYVSNLLIGTLKKNNFTVLANKESQKYKNLSIVDINTAKKMISECNSRIYSNSENALDIVLNNFKSNEFNEYINICKNKALMRKKLATLYPNFFYKEISLTDIEKTDLKNFPDSFIIKPTVGFLSMGVHKVNSKKEWAYTVSKIKEEITLFASNFPNSVLNSSNFIAEEIIKGQEYAIDTYFDDKSNAVILNIFEHPFVSKDDVSDRAYITSKKIINENIKTFEETFNKIGQVTGFKNFPVHIEVIKTLKGDVVPVEINPLRFAGWCTTDLAYYAYGINIYEYFYKNEKPDWKTILNSKNEEIYYFAMAEVPQNIDKQKICFDYKTLKKEFSKILDFRKIDYKTKPVFAIVFGQAEKFDEITKILKLNMQDYIS